MLSKKELNDLMAALGFKRIKSKRTWRISENTSGEITEIALENLNSKDPDALMIALDHILSVMIREKNALLAGKRVLLKMWLKHDDNTF